MNFHIKFYSGPISHLYNLDSFFDSSTKWLYFSQKNENSHSLLSPSQTLRSSVDALSICEHFLNGEGDGSWNNGPMVIYKFFVISSYNAYGKILNHQVVPSVLFAHEGSCFDCGTRYVYTFVRNKHKNIALFSRFRKISLVELKYE